MYANSTLVSNVKQQRILVLSGSRNVSKSYLFTDETTKIKKHSTYSLFGVKIETFQAHCFF